MTKIEMTEVDPRFGLDKEVYAVLGPDDFCQGRITAYRTWAFNDNGTILIIPNAARLSKFIDSDYFNDIESNAVPFKYLTDNIEQVKEWTRFHPSRFSGEDWYIAIGRRQSVAEMMQEHKEKGRNDNDSLEKSELGSCCANISAIRDVLIKCKENDGLIGWEIEELQFLCENSSHDFPENAPTLRRILNILNIVWK